MSGKTDGRHKTNVRKLVCHVVTTDQNNARKLVCHVVTTDQNNATLSQQTNKIQKEYMPCDREF